MLTLQWTTLRKWVNQVLTILSSFIQFEHSFSYVRKFGSGIRSIKKRYEKYEILYDTFFRWIIFELDGCYVRFISIYACVPVVPLASPKKGLKVKCCFRFKKDLFKGSPDSRHFIFEINVGKWRIRYRTTLNLNKSHL